MFEPGMVQTLVEGVRDTLYMVLASTAFGYLLGLPLGILLCITGENGIRRNPVIYRILEWYGCTATPNDGLRLTPDQQFAKIAEIERTHPWLKGKNITGVADPAIWDASRGESIEQTAARYGVYFTKGDNERIAGWMQCHYRLQFDENGYPRMYVFRNCEAFIRTIPILVYDEHKVEDLDTSMEDHCADEWRYFCMARPVRPLQKVPAQPVWADPLNQMRKG